MGADDFGRRFGCLLIFSEPLASTKRPMASLVFLASWRENMPLRLTRRDVNTQRGITLIELLVALVIVAVLSAAAVLAMPDFGARRAEVAAERIAALLGMACERAMVTGRDMGVAITADSMVFGSFSQGVFTPLPDDSAEPLRSRRLPDGIGLALRLDGHDIDLARDETPRARIACQANGELTPFALLLKRDGSPRWRITGTPSGRIERERIDAR